MVVKDLLEVLKKYPRDREILVKDSRGHCVSPEYRIEHELITEVMWRKGHQTLVVG